MENSSTLKFLPFSVLALIATAAAAQQSFTESWQARATATQNEQPHWVTPLVTVTPRLEQELRTDFVHQYNPKSFSIWNTSTFVTPGLIIGRVPLTHSADGKAGKVRTDLRSR
jgi:hypothetical protein